MLRTKLYVPPLRPETVQRPRLVDRLRAGSHRKLTLISAPAGFGKTTLLSECAATCGWPLVWISLDGGDNDPVRFWTYLIVAVQTVLPDVGEACLAMLRSSQSPPIEAFLTDLINEISDALGPPPGLPQGLAERVGPAGLPPRLVVILDDFHLISDERVHSGFTFLLDNLPPAMHLILASRADPPWPLARMRARRELTEIRAEDLRFASEEAAAFLNDAMGLDLSATDVAALDARTEGWIAGLQMAAISVRGRTRMGGAGDASRFIRSFSGSHRFILDFLVEEVLDQQSPEVQEFLLQTSILASLSGPLCDAVRFGQIGFADRSEGSAADDRYSDLTEPGSSASLSTSSQAILVQLDRANLFLIPLDDERRWYRYHRLFADLLLNRLNKTQPGAVPILHMRASEWYEGAGLIEDAVAHAFAGTAMERAARLIQKNALQVIIEGNLPTVAGWLEALPDGLIRARPWLCVYHAWTRYWTGQRGQVEECLNDAERALERPLVTAGDHEWAGEITGPRETERQHIAGYVAAIRAYCALTDSKISQALKLVGKALELLPEDSYMRSLAAIALGGVNWGLGNVEAAAHGYALASEIAERGGYPSLKVSALCYLGMQQAKQGQLHLAHDTYHEALELARGPGGQQPLSAIGFPLVKLGDLYREWNDLETADSYLAEGVKVCTQWGQADYVAESHVALARLRLAQGELGSARESLQKADQIAETSRIDPFIVCWLDDCHLRYWLLQGNLAEVVRWARTSGLRADDDPSYHHELHHINLARALMVQGLDKPSTPYLEEALGLLAKLLEAAEKAGWVQEVVRILNLRAVALDAGGDGANALESLERALVLAAPGGYVRIFFDEGTPMHGLLRQVSAGEVGAEDDGAGAPVDGELAGSRLAADYAARLLTALESGPRAPSSSGSDIGSGTKMEGLVSLERTGLGGVGHAAPAESGEADWLIEALSEREQEVLRLLATSLSTAEMADQLYIAVSTLRTHIKSIYSKLQVHSRVEAVLRGRGLDLL